jgi:hypothetical protein
MSIPRDDQVQAGLVSYLKSKSVITDQLEDGSAEEIREDHWGGTEFGYPNIRVRLISNVPVDDGCLISRIAVSFMCNSEEQSSQEADRISGIIGNTLHGTSFQSNSVNYSARLANLLPARKTDVATWTSEAIFNMIVSI